VIVAPGWFLAFLVLLIHTFLVSSIGGLGPASRMGRLRAFF